MRQFATSLQINRGLIGKKSDLNIYALEEAVAKIGALHSADNDHLVVCANCIEDEQILSNIIF